MAEDEHTEHEDDPDEATTAETVLASKLNRLFEVMHPARSRPYSNATVAAAISERYGVPISANYIWMLRNGRRRNPGMRHLQALAWFFGVDPGYFFDSQQAEQIQAELDLVAALRDAHVRGVALRTAEASPVTRDAIRAFAEHATQLEEGRSEPSRPPPTEDSSD